MPSNIQVFAWQLLLNRLLMRDKLPKRGLISAIHNLVFSLCLGPEESHSHIFVDSIVVVQVWYNVLHLVAVNTFNFCCSLVINGYLLLFDIMMWGRYG